GASARDPPSQSARAEARSHRIKEPTMTLAYVFPGQGSQRTGMGQGLFEKYPDLVAQADEILGFSIRALCLDDPPERLGQTRYTQPALYVVSALMYYERRAEGAPEPDYLAGHSLGEYNALLAGGAFDFATGLKLVKQRGELMAEAQGGAMGAVLGLSAEDVLDILENFAFDTLDVANYNSPTQTVISGPGQDIQEVGEIFTEAGAKSFVKLRVSAAFHSRYMQASGEAYARFLEPFDLAPPRIPVIANCTALPYEPGEIKANLVRQISRPVRWTESILYLLAQAQPAPDITEMGPGNVLTGLVRDIRAHAAAAR
ncbi:ACP S-malonyltransferase, partial [Methylomagnum sp.]